MLMIECRDYGDLDRTGLWEDFVGIEEKRAAGAITAKEIAWLVVTLPAWAIVAQLLWGLIPQQSPCLYGLVTKASLANGQSLLDQAASPTAGS